MQLAGACSRAGAERVWDPGRDAGSRNEWKLIKIIPSENSIGTRVEYLVSCAFKGGGKLISDVPMFSAIEGHHTGD